MGEKGRDGGIVKLPAVESGETVITEEVEEVEEAAEEPTGGEKGPVVLD